VPNYIDNYTGVAGSRYVELGETYIYPTPTMYFSANSTVGDLVFPWIDLEVISESV
jgi:hypothetical protein